PDVSPVPPRQKRPELLRVGPGQLFQGLDPIRGERMRSEIAERGAGAALRGAHGLEERDDPPRIDVRSQQHAKPFDVRLALEMTAVSQRAKPPRAPDPVGHRARDVSRYR